MDVTAVLIALLLPPAMLAVVMAMAGYEDLMLPPEPAEALAEPAGALPADPAAAPAEERGAEVLSTGE